MSQAPIIIGHDESGDIFTGNTNVNAADLSAIFNQAINVVNGNLTDSNVRQREPAKGYYGIPEARITFADSDGIGHNHDGVNSALLEPNTIGTQELYEDSEFLNNPDLTPIFGSVPFLAVGQVSFKVNEKTTSTTLSELRVNFDIGVPYDQNNISTITNLRTFATLVFGDPGPDSATKISLWNIWHPVLYTSPVLQSGMVKVEVCIEFRGATVGSVGTIDDTQGPFGVTYIVTGLANCVDPT